MLQFWRGDEAGRVESLRIFISSPGDVVEEREKAKQVIADLQRRVGDQLALIPVLWEELPLGADASFQEGIDLVVSREGIDIAIFILWSRLGSPVGSAVTRADGSRYRSGTEREFALMLEARRQSGGTRPHILAYVRQDDVGFVNRLRNVPKDVLAEEVRQQRLAEEFISETFLDQETQTNLRAYHSYPEPITFANRLRVHVRELLDARLERMGLSLSKWDGEPYRAFDVFDVEHAEIFQGREAPAAELEASLRRRTDVKFAVVLGASGSGKSSLVRAGLAANLLRFNLDDAVSRWRYSVMLPAECDGRLLKGLARLLCSATALPELPQSGIVADTLAESLAESPELAVSLALAPGFQRAGRVKLLIVVDQLEELYTDRRITAEERTRFYRALHALASSGHCWIVATLRSDFYAFAQRDRTFLNLKGPDGQFDLVAPEASELRRIITEPARLAGLQFELDADAGRSLDQVLLDDASAEPDALPLLEFALHELYQRRTGRMLTFRSYREELGGLKGAVGRRAESVFAALPSDAQAALPVLLQRLVTVDPESESTLVRRRSAYDPADSTSAVGQLSAALTSARLLTAGEVGGESTITLAHEALIQSWTRLADWVAANQRHLRLRARVESDHARWRAHNADPSLLLAEGLPVEEGKTLLEEAPHLLDSHVESYLRSSIKHHAGRVKQRTRRRQAIFASLAVLAMTAAGAGLWAHRQRGVAERLLAAASFREATVQVERGRPAAALAFVARALRLDATHAGARALSLDLILHGRWPETIAENAEPVQTVRWSPDGNRIATVTATGVVRLIDLATNHNLGDPLPDRASSPAAVTWSPDGTRIAVGGLNDIVRIFDARTGKAREPVLAVPNPPRFRIVLPGIPEGVGEPQPSRVLALAWSPDGAQLATTHQGNRVLLWDVRTGQQTGSVQFSSPKDVFGMPLDVHNLEWSPDGSRIITRRGEEVEVWETRAGRPAVDAFLRGGPLSIVKWSTDGSYVVTGSERAPLRVWDARTGRAVGDLPIDGSAVYVAWSSDSKRIATAAAGTFQIRNAQTGQLVGTPVQHGTSSVAWSPDGTRVVDWSNDVAKIWDIGTGHRVGDSFRHPATVADVGWSPDARRVVTASSDGTVRVWNAWTTEKLGTPLLHDNSVGTVMWSADAVSTTSDNGVVQTWDLQGRRVATVPLDAWRAHGSANEAAWSPDGTHIAIVSFPHLALWDGTTGRRIAVLPHPDGQRITSLAWSPDGTRIVTAAINGNVLFGRSTASESAVRLWDARTGQTTGEGWTARDDVYAIAWSPDGRRIITGSRSGTIQLWNPATGQEVAAFPAKHEGIGVLAFSPRGTYIVTGSRDGTARVWEARTGQPIGVPMQHEDDVIAVAWSPDETRIVTGSFDSTARVWDARTGLPLGNVLRHQNSIFAVAWNSAGTHVATASADRTARIWDLPALTPAEARRLAPLAEIIGGVRVNQDDGLERMPDWGTRRWRTIEELKRARPAGTADSSLDKLLRWAFSSPPERTISPESALTFEEYVGRILSLGDLGRAEIDGMFPGYRRSRPSLEQSSHQSVPR